MNNVLLLCGDIPKCRLWKNNTGSIKVGERCVKFGLKGSADIVGLTSDGKFLAIECKTGDAVLKAHQRSFRRMILLYGGRHIVVKRAEDAYLYITNLHIPATVNFHLDDFST